MTLIHGLGHLKVWSNSSADEEHMQIGIIINPSAGRRDARRFQRHVEEFCSRSNLRPTMRIVHKSERIETAAREIASTVDLIGVVGGDGTMNGVVNGLMTSSHPSTPIAYFPAGRGKDIARTLSAWHLSDIASASDGYTLRPVDVGMITTGQGTTRYFLNETSIGIGAVAASGAGRYPRSFGTSSYLLATLDGILRERPFHARLDFDNGDPVELHRCHHITLANGRYFGGGLQIAPKTEPDDGLLDLISVADISATELVRVLPRLFNATPLDHPSVCTWKVKTVTIETTPPALVESDGEQRDTTPVTCSILRHALTWVEPQ